MWDWWNKKASDEDRGFCQKILIKDLRGGVILEKNRAWMYCRVGHSGESSAGVLKMQEISMESYAAHNGLTITARTFDVGSGVTMDRPSLHKIKRAATGRKIDVLLLFDLSRLGRDMEQVRQYWRFLRENNVRICTATEGEVNLGMGTNILNTLERVYSLA